MEAKRKMKKENLYTKFLTPKSKTNVYYLTFQYAICTQFTQVFNFILKIKIC